MRKDSKILNRTLAIAIAAAMAVTSAPSMAFAGDVFEDGVVTEVVDAETAEVEAAEAEVIEEAAETDAEEAAETDAAAVDESTEADVFGDGSEELVSDEDTAQTDLADAADATAEAQNPGKVTNLYTNADDSDTLYWYGLDAADYYQICAESNGQLYMGYGRFDRREEDSSTGKTVYYYYPEAIYNQYYDLTDLKNFHVATLQTDGTVVFSEDSEGNDIPLQPGTYSVKVRAVNENDASYGEKVTYGEWSDAFTYTVKAAETPDKVTNIKIEDGVLTFNATGYGYGVAMSITDSQGREYYNYVTSKTGTDGTISSYEYGYATAYTNCKLTADNFKYSASVWHKDATTGYYVEDEDADGKVITPFQVGTTYTIKLAGIAWDAANKKYIYSDWSEAVTYTPVAESNDKPETTKVTITSGSYITWKAVSDALGYEVRVMEGTTEYKAGDNYYTPDDEDDTYVSVSTLKKQTYVTVNGEKVYPDKAGKTYSVQVRAYNKKTSDATEYQYGDWSEAVTYTEDAATAPAAPQSVVLSSAKTLSWQEVDGADHYVITITDSKNRQYYYSLNSTKDAGVDYTTKGTSVNLGGYWDEDDKEWYDGKFYYYVSVDGVWQKAKYSKVDATSRTAAYISALTENGMTYTITVQAVARDKENAKDVPGGKTSITYTCTEENYYVNGTPATVTGLNIVTESDDPEVTLSGATLHWNYIDNVYNYEFVVNDGTYDYVDGINEENGEYVKDYRIAYVYVDDEDDEDDEDDYHPYYSISDLSGLAAYVKEAGTATYIAKGTDGKELKTFEAGKTYTIRVRAVKYYHTWDVDSNSWTKAEPLYGEWSDAVTYTAPAAASITDLAFVREDDNYYYFTYSADVSNSQVYYQIAEDDKFTLASLVTGGWRRAADGADEDASETAKLSKLCVNGDSLSLTAGKTYYIRAVVSTTGSAPTDEDLEGKTIPSTTFTAKAESTAKNITNLRLYNETGSSYVFRFDAVLEDEDSYELQYSYTNASDANWISVGETTTLSKDDLNEGTVYVRAIAYVTKTDTATGKSEKVYGTASNVVTLTYSLATSTISAIQLSEKTPISYVFTYTGTIRKGEQVQYWWSTDSSFATYDSDVTDVDTDDGKNEFEILYSDLTPGKTYYVKARVVNPYAVGADQYSAFTAAISFTAALPKVKVESAVVTNTSVQLTVGTVSSEEFMTGFEFQRKNGKKWISVAKVTDNTVTDKKLKKDTTYTYRVRAFYYNTETKKTTNGSWTYYETTTWGGALKLKATAKSSTSIKLSWAKISGAQGYEVYRKVTDSDYSTKANGEWNDYEKYVLVKTIKKGSTKTYTDKKLNKNLSYTYLVRAYKKVGSKKYYISDTSNEVTLSFGDSFKLTKTVKKANGSVTISWSRVYGASGYLIEKENNVTDEYETYATVKSTKTSYTLPANTEDETVYYRIRAYKGTQYSESQTVGVSSFLAAPTGVKATVNKSTGSITVTWNAVSGADYYKVWRTTSSQKTYNSTTKAYSFMYGKELAWYVADSSRISGYRKVTDEEDLAELNTTTYVDQTITYTNNGVTNTLVEGPETDVTYYYYVEAYKLGTGHETVASKSVIAVGGDSAAAKATISSGVTVKKPTIKKAKASSKKITVTWKKVSGAEGYVIYRSTKKKGTYTEVGTVTKGSTVKYVDKTVTKGTTYYYKIKAYKLNSAGIPVLSKYSAVKSAKAK